MGPSFEQLHWRQLELLLMLNTKLNYVIIYDVMGYDVIPVNYLEAVEFETFED